MCFISVFVGKKCIFARKEMLPDCKKLIGPAGCQIVYIMKNSLLLVVLLSVMSVVSASFASVAHNRFFVSAGDDGQEEDSVISVVAWFNENDTMTYWITEGNWKYEGGDTVKTLGVYTKVMITVTDSTRNGYDMEYRFMEFGMDTAAGSWMQDFMRASVEKLQEKVAGTAIKFHTDEYGHITKYKNLGEIKRLAKRVFSDMVDGMPYVDSLAAVGVDIDDYIKYVDTDELVQGYVEELEMLFACHGNQYLEGEFKEHTDASETEYESDSYTAVWLDKESYGYEIVIDVDNYIPKADIKELVGSVVDMLVDEDKAAVVKKGMNAGFDEALTGDAVYNDYLYMSFFYDGWPEEVVSQKRTVIGSYGRLVQKHISWDYRSVCNFD